MMMLERQSDGLQSGIVIGVRYAWLYNGYIMDFEEKIYRNEDLAIALLVTLRKFKGIKIQEEYNQNTRRIQGEYKKNTRGIQEEYNQNTRRIQE